MEGCGWVCLGGVSRWRFVRYIGPDVIPVSH
jgi:hypothetical protein